MLSIISFVYDSNVIINYLKSYHQLASPLGDSLAIPKIAEENREKSSHLVGASIDTSC